MDTIVLVKNGLSYRVEISNYSFVSASEVPCLLGKTVSDIWRWARINSAKFYFAPFLPPHIEKNYAISHA